MKEVSFVCSSSIIFADGVITLDRNNLDKYYGDSAYLISMVKKWVIDFFVVT